MNRRGFMIASSLALAGGLLGATVWPNRWKYIVIHHSAGPFGDIEFLQRVHRQRQPGDPIDAIPYHYVIGNGNGLRAGEIASDWRRTLNIWGTHVSTRNTARNFFGIGVCLIGNLEKAPMPDEQFQALVGLTRRLMQQYEIPPGNVQGHGLIPGENTKCPGRHFPMTEFMSAIA